MIKTLGRDWRSYFAIGIIACLVAFAIRGQKGFAGMSLGLLGTTFNLLAWRWIISGMRPGGNPAVAAPWIVIAFFLKLPLIYGLWVAAGRIGGTAQSTFLDGLGLVYFGLIWWATSQE